MISLSICWHLSVHYVLTLQPYSLYLFRPFQQNALAIWHIILELPLVQLAVFECVFTLTMFFSVLEIAFVFLLCDFIIPNSLSVLHSLFELSFIQECAIFKGSLSIKLSVHNFALVADFLVKYK